MITGFKLKILPCIIIWLLFLVLGTLSIHKFNQEIQAPSDAFYYLHTAKNIASGKGVIELYNYAYRPPLFSVFLAILYKLRIEDVFIIKHILLLLFSSSVILIYILCGMLFGRNAAIGGSLLFAIFPRFIAIPNLIYAESLYIPLLLVLFITLCNSMKRPSIKNYAISGIVCGLSTLCREISLYIPLIILVVIIIHRKILSANRARNLLIFILFQALIIAPWTIRNYRIFNKFIPVTTNSWINIYIGNNPKYDNIYSFNWIIPENTKWNTEEQVDGKNEYEVMIRSRDEALLYIKSYPGHFIKRFCLKVINFITPNFKLVLFSGPQCQDYFLSDLRWERHTCFLPDSLFMLHS